MKFPKIIFLLPLFLCQNPLLWGQNDNEDAFFIKSIHDQALKHGQAYDWLFHLSENIGARLSGSPQAAAAVEYTFQMLDTLSLDSVWLQPCMVPHWERGEPEILKVINSPKVGDMEFETLALGNSIGTGPDGVTGEVVEVTSLDELDTFEEGFLAGKIVFFNRPMDPTQFNTFRAYGGAVDQRVWGASRAAKHGAVGVVVRSMSAGLNDIPHTGSMAYEDGVAKIPALSISTNDAEKLSSLIKTSPVTIYMRNTSRMLSKKLSYNVIGEIKGSEFPDEIILVGGHLDSWDVGGGAHDDGAGCVHSMDVLNILNQLNYKPKRTIRCVLFMNEENGLAGSVAYQEASDKKNEFHLAAIESDRGGFSPQGFTADGDASIFKEKFKKVLSWASLLEPYELRFAKGGSGADISRLKSQKGLLFGLKPDSQRYFDYHHTPADNIDTVNRRELELGSAAMASLVYLIDKYGLD